MMGRNKWLWSGAVLVVAGVLILVAGHPAPGVGRQPMGAEGARAQVRKYLAELGGDKRFAVSEVWDFTTGPYYAAVQETASGRGAFELLVDRYTGAISPEPGPNMMWNLKYGLMGGNGMMGGRGMMGGGYGPGMTGYRVGYGSAQNGADPRVTAPAARDRAQAYLNRAVPGAKVLPAGASDEFYGYWTLDFDRNGKLAGMLSVNASTGDVWLHTWHATPTGVVGEEPD